MIALVLAQGLPVGIGVLLGFILGKAWGRITACEEIERARAAELAAWPVQTPEVQAINIRGIRGDA